jgi:hypothetical protein
MFDQENHTIDPVTGFVIHKDDGHLIGIEQVPSPVVRGVEWPKWVVPHDSQIQRKKTEGFPDHVSTPGFADYNVNRVNGEVMVLVADEDEEKVATGEYKERDPKDTAPVFDDAMRRAVRADVARAKLDLANALAREEAQKQADIEDEEVARRVTERQELEVRNLEAADAAAKAQRERTAGSLGVDVDPRYVPSTVRPGDWRGKTGDVGSVVNSDVDPRYVPSNDRQADQRTVEPEHLSVDQQRAETGVDVRRSGQRPNDTADLTENARTAERSHTPGQPYSRPSVQPYTPPNEQLANPTDRNPGQPNRATPVYPTNKG